MRIMTLRNWERPVRIAAILILVLTLLSPLGSLVFADDGTTPDPPVTEETEPPDDGESEGENQAVAETPPVEDEGVTTGGEDQAVAETPPVEDEGGAAGGEDQAVAETPPVEDDGGTTEGETCPATEEVEAVAGPEPVDATAPPDPRFTVGGTEYNYTSIQDAIDDLSGNGWTPEGGVVLVEDGTFTEDVVIDGSTWVVGPTPSELILQSDNGSDVTIVDGSVLITNMQNFILNGFTVNEGVVAQDNVGSLTIQDVVATNTNGDAISVENHTGDVTLQDVNASGSADGTLGNNVGNGVFVDANAGGSITLSNVTANNNEESGALLVFDSKDTTNEILVSDSVFKDNGQFGVWAQPEDGTVTFKCIKTAGNGSGDTMVPVGETVIWIQCEKTCKDKGDKDEYKDTVIKTEKEKYVNVGHGMMVKFPAIVPVVEGDKSYGRFRPILEPDKLPADLLPGDFFMVGVDIIMVNAVIPEGESIIVEFFIAGYQWEENFAVLWFDAGAVDWVDVPFTKVPHERIPGGKIVAEWDQPGIFILVLREEIAPDA